MDKYSGILNKHAEQSQGVGTPTATATVANTQLEYCCPSVLLTPHPRVRGCIPVIFSARSGFCASSVRTCRCMLVCLLISCWHFINISSTCIFNRRQKRPVPPPSSGRVQMNEDARQNKVVKGHRETTAPLQAHPRASKARTR